MALLHADFMGHTSPALNHKKSPSWVSIGWRHGNHRNKRRSKTSISIVQHEHETGNDSNRISNQIKISNSNSGPIAVTMMALPPTLVASIEKPITEHGNNRNSVTSNEGNGNINLIITILIIHNSNDD
jgi:hypothetical protein